MLFIFFSWSAPLFAAAHSSAYRLSRSLNWVATSVHFYRVTLLAISFFVRPLSASMRNWHHSHLPSCLLYMACRVPFILWFAACFKLCYPFYSFWKSEQDQTPLYRTLLGFLCLDKRFSSSLEPFHLLEQNLECSSYLTSGCSHASKIFSLRTTLLRPYCILRSLRYSQPRPSRDSCLKW